MVDKKLLYSIGAVFLAIAFVLTIRELDLGVGWSISLLLLGLTISAEFYRNGVVHNGSVITFSLMGLLGPGAYFLIGPETSFYVATLVYFVCAMYLNFRFPLKQAPVLEETGQLPAGHVRAIALSFAGTASSMLLLWVTYFRFFTLMQDEFIARRLYFTIFLLAIGIGLSIMARTRSSKFLGFAGASYLIVAVGKALAYDTTHLTGFLRIGVFALGGVILLLGAGLMSKKESKK